MLGARGLRCTVARVPALVWAATAAFTVTLAAYSVLLPLYEAPDEPGHVDLVMLLADGGDHPAYDGRLIGTGTEAGCAPYIATPRWCPGGRPADALPPSGTPVEHAAGDAPSKGALPTYDELGGSEPGHLRNQLAQHPPLYYRLMAGALRVVRFVVPGEMSLAGEVALLRLLSSLLVAPLPLLAWATGRRLGLGRRVASTAALLPLVIPQLLHISSTVNNDTLLIGLGGVVTVLVATILGGDRRWGTTVALAAAMVAALLTKSSAVAFVPLVGLAYLVAWWRAGGPVLRGERGTILFRAAAVAGGVAVLAGWWYIGNKVTHGSFVPSTDTEGIRAMTPPTGFRPRATEWMEAFAAYVTPRFWAWFGWFSVRGTFRLLVAASVIALTLLITGVAAPRTGATPAGPRPRRLDLGLVLVPGLALLAMVVVRGWSLYTSSGAYPFLQGRYLFPAVAGGAVVAACGVDRLLHRWAAPAVLLWALVMHGDAVRAILTGYWAGEGDGLAGRLRSLVAWNPWPGELLGLGAVAALAVGVLLVVTVVRSVRTDPDQTIQG